MSETNNAAFIWSIANLLRGTYKPADYGKVILPFTVLRRLDSALEASKNKVLDEFGKNKNAGAALDFLLQKASGYSFYNTSPYDLKKAAGDTTNLKANLLAYIEGFSPNVRDIFEKYEFTNQLNKLDENDLLLLVVQRFSSMDLHPEKVSNTEMGLIFEELIRKFAEASNETAGDHFTPRDVVRLIVNLLFATDDEVLSKPGVVRSVYDPTAGTGGMLSVADDYIHHLNPEARLTLFGQDYNDESFAIAKADMVIKGQDIENMVFGDTLTNDGHHGKHFDYCLANPPFGVEWKKQQAFVEREYREKGFDGRFGAGLPRVSDGSFLFLLHLVKKMRPTTQGGGRIGIVLNGSPLATGGAGSSESNIRKYLLEQDLVEAIVALPKEMFYNTPIATYIWILSNHKTQERKGRVQLIDASKEFERMRKPLGDKRNEITQQNIQRITNAYSSVEESDVSKILTTNDFGYTTVTVERPLRLAWYLESSLFPRLFEGAKFLKLSANVKTEITDTLASLALQDDLRTTSEKEFIQALTHSLRDFGLTASQLKSISSTFAHIDPEAPIVQDSKGNPVYDPDLKDSENVPFGIEIESFIESELRPFNTEFHVDPAKYKTGFEISFLRHFHQTVGQRLLNSIDTEVNGILDQISNNLREIEERQKLVLNQFQTQNWNPVQASRYAPSFLSPNPSWSAIPFRKICMQKKELVGEDWKDYQLLSLTRGGVVARDIDSGIGKFPSEFDGYQILEPDDLVFCLFDVEETPRTVGRAKQLGMITSAYTRYVVDKSIASPAFLEWLFVAIDDLKLFKPYYSGLRNTVSKDILGSTLISLPPLQEQIEIVRTLQTHVDHIEELDAKVMELSSALRERRQALVRTFVTGGVELGAGV